MAVVDSITAIVTRYTFAVVTLERRGAAYIYGWLIDMVFYACQVIGSQLHAIGATTYPLEIWNREAEVAAVAIWVGGSITVVGT